MAGLAGGAAFFKLQQALIVLIPGLCLGRKKFVYGCFLMAVLEVLLSAYVVGYNNIFNFVRANYLCEIAHAYVGLNETWAMFSFRGLLAGLSNNLVNADRIAFIAYALACMGSAVLWIKVYPSLQKKSNQAFALIASLSTCALVYFSLHNYFYDYLLMFIPVIWLYIWSTSNDEAYTVRQSVFRLLISLLTFITPFLFLTGLDLGDANTNVGYELKLFFGSIVFLICAAEAIIIEYQKGRQVDIKI